MLMLVAHGDQKDLAGEPYWLHPQAVGNAAYKNDYSGSTPNEPSQAELEEAIVGYLHDVLEDTHVNAHVIYNLFGGRVGQMVDVLTRRWDQTYEEFIERIAHSSYAGAQRVKLSDIRHNLMRIENITDEAKRERLKTRYLKAYNRLWAVVVSEA